MALWDRKNESPPAVADLRLWSAKAWICAAAYKTQCLDCDTGQPTWSRPNESWQTVQALAVEESSNRLMIASDSGRIDVINPSIEGALLSLSLGDEVSSVMVHSLDFDGDANSLLAVADDRLVRFDTPETKPVELDPLWALREIGPELVEPPIAALRKLIGSEQTVDFRVQVVGGREKRYLNSRSDWQHAGCFTAVIEPDQTPALGELGLANPSLELPGKLIRVSGKLEEHDQGRGLAIHVSSVHKQLEIVADGEKSE